MLNVSLSQKDLEVLAQTRLDDAKLLLAHERWSSAYYLAGYVVELALKACIAKQFQAHAIPSKDFVSTIYTHKLGVLLKEAGLEIPKPAQDLATYWALTSKWTETSRYEIKSRADAEAILEAVGHPQHGVFTWVKTNW